MALIARQKATRGRTIAYTYGQIVVTGGNRSYQVNGTAVFGVTQSGVNQQMWVGRTLFATQAEVGAARVEWGERDYLCSVADFQALVGVGTTPIQGDRIADVDPNGNPIVFEVQVSTGEPAQRLSDQTRQAFRMHCKKVQ